MGKVVARYIIVFITILGMAFIGRAVILGGAPVVSLQKASPIAGIVAQTLYSTSDYKVGVPVEGKDFQIVDTQYLSDNQWVVAKIKLTNSTAGNAIIVFQKTNGIYRAVLGPGTSFSADFLRNVPSDVASHLSNEGAIYESNE